MLSPTAKSCEDPRRPVDVMITLKFTQIFKKSDIRILVAKKVDAGTCGATKNVDAGTLWGDQKLIEKLMRRGVFGFRFQGFDRTLIA